MRHGSSLPAKTAIIIALAILLMQLPMNLQRVAGAQASDNFTFSAAGDFGFLSSGDGLASLQRLGTSGSNFFLGLGDMSVNDSVTGHVWCSQFKSTFNDMELVAGDHDTGGHNDTIFQETNDYNQYLAGCPHVLNSPITCGLAAGNCYGKEYYFDYPYPNSLARFIFVSPKIYNITGVCTAQLAGTLCSSQTGQPCTDQHGCWEYHVNDIHYNWTSQAIDDARAEGIKWVIVVMHKECISAGVNTCSMGIDFFNMLLAKKVDLIVQAHDESYQRSKQIALNDGCASITTTGNGWVPYDSNCIVDDGSTGRYVPGKGTVIVIQGDWGRGWDPVNDTSVSNGQNAAEAPYFATLMGQNTPGRGHGLVTYTVSPDRIDVQTSFAGTYQDNFTISTFPYSSHSSISISNNKEFTAVNGVAQGNGSASSPYLIQGWEIQSGTTGIEVTNTTAYFVIRDVYLPGLNTGISFLNVVNGAIESSVLYYDDNGIVVSNSSSSLIDNNEIVGGGEGIVFNNSNHDVCSHNTVSGSTVQGITVSQESANVTLSDNLLTNESTALAIVNAKNASIASNHIVSSSLGIYIEDSNDTTLYKNTIANNLEGIDINQSQMIGIFHNDFIANTGSPPVQIQFSDAAYWDDGYPSGGNFWSDYGGSDNCSGPSQNICPGGDGIGDTPYKIDGTDQDSYPLTEPYGPEPSPAPTWPSPSALVAINIDRDSLALTWTKATDINGVSSYLVYESNVLIATLSGTILPLAGLKLGATYTFSVQAVDAWSNESVDGPQLTVRVLAQGGDLGIESLTMGIVYQGGVSRLEVKIANLGEDDARVTSLVASGDIGTFSSTGLQASLPSGTNGTYSLTANIPRDSHIGNHTITVTVDWQYYAPQTSSWVDATPLSMNSWLFVKSSGLPATSGPTPPNELTPTSLSRVLSNPLTISGLSCFLALAIGFAIMRRNRHKHGPKRPSEAVIEKEDGARGSEGLEKRSWSGSTSRPEKKS